MLAVLWGASALRAELTWKDTTVEINAEAKDEVLSARFRFTNDGPTPVDIRQIDSTCGCTTAALEKRHYEPGEGGEIVARYTIGDHVGLQKKSVLVTASDHPDATILSIVAHIPEVLRLGQTFVTWRHDEPVAPKTIRLAAPPHTVTLENLSVQASSGAVTAVLQNAEDGDGFDLRVTPVATDQPAFTTLVIHCRLGNVEKTFRAYATVEQGVMPARGPAPAMPAASATPAAQPSPPATPPPPAG